MTTPSPVTTAAMSDEELASHLRTSVTRLYRRLRQEVVEGLSPTQIAAMATVHRRGTPTLGELADAEQMQPPSMTRVVESLVEGGFALRLQSSDDRRVWRVELTPKGEKTLARIKSRRTAFLVQRFERLSDEERRLLGPAVELLDALLVEP